MTGITINFYQVKMVAMRLLTKCLMYLVIAFIVLGCQQEDVVHHSDSIPKKDSSASVFYIDAPRSVANIVHSGGLRSLEAGNDVCEYREVNRTNVVVLPEGEPHIWVGNILYRSALTSNIYRPIRGKKSPIMLSTSVARIEPKQIVRPTLSSYTNYVNETGLLLERNLDTQDFAFEIEQFSSYNELKAAFGSNVNVANLLSLQDEVPSLVEPKIKQATGLYVRFHSVAFNVQMDVPGQVWADVAPGLVDSAVYVSSVSYGKLGVLTLECNVEANAAKQSITEISKKLFRRKEKTMTREERDFLQQCTFRLYMLGGDGGAVVKSFQGAESFVEAMIEVNARETIVPIYYTLSNLRDNSLHSSRFRYRISYEPLYVRFESHGSHWEDQYSAEASYSVDLCFYRDSQYERRAIADPAIIFNINHMIGSTYGIDFLERKDEPLRLQNTNRSISMHVGYVVNEHKLIPDPGSGYDIEGRVLPPDYSKGKLKTVYHTFELMHDSRFIAKEYFWSGELPNGNFMIR